MWGSIIGSNPERKTNPKRGATDKAKLTMSWLSGKLVHSFSYLITPFLEKNGKNKSTGRPMRASMKFDGKKQS